jgi:hypothetical protein
MVGLLFVENIFEIASDGFSTCNIMPRSRRKGDQEKWNLLVVPVIRPTVRVVGIDFVCSTAAKIEVTNIF